MLQSELGDYAQKVGPGDPLPTRADFYNALSDVIKWFREGGPQRLGSSAPVSVGKDGPVEVLVRNTTGATVPQFGILKVNAPTILPSASAVAFADRRCLDGTTPDTASAFVVAQEPIAAGSIGRALILGVTPCKINLLNVSDRWAGPTADPTQLTSNSAEGPAVIVWVDNASVGTLRDAVVVVNQDNDDGSPPPTTAPPPPGSGSGGVTDSTGSCIGVYGDWWAIFNGGAPTYTGYSAVPSAPLYPVSGPYATPAQIAALYPGVSFCPGIAGTPGVAPPSGPNVPRPGLIPLPMAPPGGGAALPPQPRPLGPKPPAIFDGDGNPLPMVPKPFMGGPKPPAIFDQDGNPLPFVPKPQLPFVPKPNFLAPKPPGLPASDIEPTSADFALSQAFINSNAVWTTYPAIAASLAAAGTTNNWAPGNASSIQVTVTGVGDATVTGLLAGFDGQMITIENLAISGANNLKLQLNNAGSAAANQLNNGNAVGFDVLTQNTVVQYQYFSTLNKWRKIK